MTSKTPNKEKQSRKADLFIKLGEWKTPPTLVQVKRTRNSKFWVNFILREIQLKLRVSPCFITWTKESDYDIRSLLEEETFLREPKLFCLYNTPKDFFKRISIVPNYFIVAETSEGDLEGPPFKRHNLPTLVSFLKKQFNLQDYGNPSGLPWIYLESYSGIEAFLLKAKYAEWTWEEVKKKMEGIQYRNLPKELFKSTLRTKEGRDSQRYLLSLVDKYGPEWFWIRILELTVSTYFYKKKKELKVNMTELEAGLSPSEKSELALSDSLLTILSLYKLSQRVLQLTDLADRDKYKACQLLIFRSNMSV